MCIMRYCTTSSNCEFVLKSNFSLYFSWKCTNLGKQNLEIHNYKEFFHLLKLINCGTFHQNKSTLMKLNEILCLRY